MAPPRIWVDRMVSPRCSPGPFQMEGTLPPAGSLPSSHQTTTGTDSSPEEILRQAGCKQQPGEGAEQWRGAQQRQERLPEEKVIGKVGRLLEREPAK